MTCLTTGQVTDLSGNPLPTTIVVLHSAVAGIAPIEGKTVASSNIRLTTDGSGNIPATHLLAGDWVLEIQIPGRVPLRRPFNIRAEWESARLDQLLSGDPGYAYELVTFAQWQAGMALAAPPFASTALGIAGTTDGAMFLMATGDTLTTWRRVGAAAVLIQIDLA